MSQSMENNTMPAQAEMNDPLFNANDEDTEELEDDIEDEDVEYEDDDEEDDEDEDEEDI